MASEPRHGPGERRLSTNFSGQKTLKSNTVHNRYVRK